MPFEGAAILWKEENFEKKYSGKRRKIDALILSPCMDRIWRSY